MNRRIDRSALLVRVVVLSLVAVASTLPAVAAAQDDEVDPAAGPTAADLEPAEEPATTETESGDTVNTVEAVEPDDGATAGARVEGTVGDARVIAGLREGVRVEVPELADFVFEAHLAAWARYVVDVPMDAQAAQYFEMPLVRPLLQARVFDGMFQLLVQPELAGANPRLLDLHLDFVLDPAFRIRVGQFRTPMSRAFITPIIMLQMPDRGVVSDTFRAGRDTGLMVFGTAGPFEYALGVFNGAGINARLGDTPAPMVVGRAMITPYGEAPYDETPSLTRDSPSGLAVGVDGFFRERDVALPGDPEMVRTTGTGGIDVALVEGPFALFAEGYVRGQTVAGSPWQTSWGAYAQAGLFVVPRIFEISVRAGLVDPDVDVSGDFVQSYEGTLAGYFFFEEVAYGNHLKLNLRYRFADTATGFGPLAPGSSHQVMLQLQVWM